MLWFDLSQKKTCKSVSNDLLIPIIVHLNINELDNDKISVQVGHIPVALNFKPQNYLRHMVGGLNEKIASLMLILIKSEVMNQNFLPRFPTLLSYADYHQVMIL